MNEFLIGILKNKIVADLPKAKKEIYNYVIEVEDEIAQKTATAEEFMLRVRNERPHERAAKHFDMSISELLHCVNEIDKEIGNQLEINLNAVTWNDCTELMKFKVDRQEKLFLLSFPL